MLLLLHSNRGFDFGNYFCEFMFNNNYEHAPYFQYNPEMYPNKAQQLLFIETYLQKFKELNEKKRLSRNVNDEDDDDELNSDNDEKYKKRRQIDLYTFDEEHLLIEANSFALASHLFWAMWAVCQAAASKIKFGYLVILRLNFFIFLIIGIEIYFSTRNML